MKSPLLLLFACTFTALGISQAPLDETAPAAGPAAAAVNPYHHDWKRELGEGNIQDNSFMIEEAYNQEFGVVQHISNFTRLWQSKTWAYSFTQEWPVDHAPKNQLSYTVVATHSGDFPTSGSGAGDTILNYRYQLVGSGETRIAVAPRFSLLVPSGNSAVGRGFGGLGFQTNWAASVVVNKKIVTHWNTGATMVPHARNAEGLQASTYAYNLGQSTIWTIRPRFNALVETVFNRNESVVATDKTQWGNQLLISPGVRWSHNLSNGLQIVPGVAMPIGVGPSHGEKGLFFYLSLEHPYRRIPAKAE